MQFEQELWLSKCHTATLRHKTGTTNLNSAHRLDESVEYCPALCLEIDLCCKDHEHHLCPLNRSVNVLKWNNWAWKKDSWGQPNWSLINPSTGFSDGCKSYDLWLDWGVRSGFPPPSSLKHQHLFEKNAGHPISSGSLYQKADQAARAAFFPLYIFTRAVPIMCRFKKRIE